MEPAKVANFFVYLVAAWLLSGRFFYAFLLAGAVAGLAALEYAWATVQTVGIVLLITAFLKISGLLPFWPA